MILALTLLGSAHGADVDFACSPEVGGVIVGLPPLEVRCVAELPAEGSWSDLVWTFGDGTVVSGESAISHTYDGPGQYTVALALENFDSPLVDTGLAGLPEEEPSSYLEERKYGYVTTCETAKPEFTFVFKGGLTYQLVNTTQPLVHCIDEVKWTVHEGDSARGVSVLDPIDTWEPKFTLPDEGTYTIVLSMGGIAGTESARLTIDAKYGLTEELDNVRATNCSTAPGVGGLAFGVVLLGLRRRR